jgi:hypothetical protein
MHSRHLCERGIYDGGPNDPRTLVYRYQQRLRADLLAKAADEANRTARWPACLLATRAAVRASVESFQADLPVERCPATVVPYHRVIERRRRRSKLGVIGLQGRVVDLVAGHRVLSGTLEEFAAHLHTAAPPLREALRELCTLGWIAAQTQPDGQLTLCLERRHRAGTIPASGERRRPAGGGRAR